MQPIPASNPPKYGDMTLIRYPIWRSGSSLYVWGQGRYIGEQDPRDGLDWDVCTQGNETICGAITHWLPLPEETTNEK